MAGDVVHVLSHRRLEVRVMSGSLGTRVRWPVPGPEYDSVAVVPIEAVASLPHATLTRRILEVAQARRDGLVSRRE
jgi:hypothetical protein